MAYERKCDRMKKYLLIFVVGIFTYFIVNAYTGFFSRDNISEVQNLEGYIYIEDNELYFDSVEIVTGNDMDRIKELNLIEANDYPNGYYIYNPETDVASYELTDDTQYVFTDSKLLFVKEADSDRIYETSEKQEFIEGSSYQNISLEQQRIPYYIVIQENQVISIREEFIYTQ
jgi:hypothetical protein